MMGQDICIQGSKDFLYLALEDRLKRSGINIISDPKNASSTIGIDTKYEVDLLIVPKGSKNNNGRLVITIHDLIIPTGHSKWSPKDIYLFVEQIKNNEINIIDKSKIHYLVHIRDAIEAISMIVLSNNFHDSRGTMNICGRRAWSNESIFNEIKMLWTRFHNSIHYTHTESLSKIPSIISENNRKNRERPNLDSLNKELIRAGGDGWHPLTPLRTGLMELLAQNL
jgi:nucleoside-diphosphate-sugar epimerase